MLKRMLSSSAIVLIVLMTHTLRGAFSQTAIIPPKTFTAAAVIVNDRDGDIAVLQRTRQHSHILVYTAAGVRLSDFHPLSNVTAIAWLPHHHILAAVSFPHRGHRPVIYSIHGRVVGQFGKTWPVLEMFWLGGKGYGRDVTPGGMLVAPGGDVYVSATWALRDFLSNSQVQRWQRTIDTYFKLAAAEGAKVLVFRPNGTLVRTIGRGWGRQDGAMTNPGLMAFNATATRIAVQDKFGIEIFSAADGRYIRRLVGYRLQMQSRASFLVVSARGRHNLMQIDFHGRVRKTYPPIPALSLNSPWNGGYAAADGTLYVPGGPGLTIFRKFSVNEKLLLANGQRFRAMAASCRGTPITAGQRLRLRVRLQYSSHYYRLKPTPLKVYAFARSMLLGGPWQALKIAADNHHVNIHIPASMKGAGLAQIRLTNQPQATAPLAVTLTMPMTSNAAGSVTALTTMNRHNWLAGEAVNFEIIVRVHRPQTGLVNMWIYARRRHAAVASAALPFSARWHQPAVLHVILGRAGTRLLGPGRYELLVKAGTLRRYDCRFDLISQVPLTRTLRTDTWDSGFFSNQWGYHPLLRSEILAWCGINALVRMRHYDFALHATVMPGYSGLLNADPNLPAPEFGWQPNQWQEVLDRGVKDGLGFMPIVHNIWEAYPVFRTPAMLARDQQAIGLMAQSLGRFPNFLGLDYNVTNFLIHTYPHRFVLGGGKIPTPREIQALAAGRWNPSTMKHLGRWFDFITGRVQKDYRAWGQALAEYKPGVQRMADIGFWLHLASWPPALNPYVTTTDCYQQSEQIPPPFGPLVEDTYTSMPWLPNASTYEVFNETGTGERMESEEALGMLTGSAIGMVSPPMAGWNDSHLVRISAHTDRGDPWVYREFFRRYATVQGLLTTRNVRSPVGLLLTKRQAVLEQFTRPNIGGPNFGMDSVFGGGDSIWSRFYSGVLLCQMAHRPARAIFGQYLRHLRTFKGLKAIMLTGQTAPLRAWQIAALQKFQQRGGVVLEDRECKVWVPGARRLGVAVFSLPGFGFGGLINLWQTDGNYDLIPQMILHKLPAFARALKRYVPAGCSATNPLVMMTPFAGGKITYLAVVNTQRPPIPGLEYSKIQARFATVMPLIAQVKVPTGIKTVYDVLNRRRLPIRHQAVSVDLRAYANTVLALSPGPIPQLTLAVPPRAQAGKTLTVALQVTQPGGSAFAAVVPFLLEVRSAGGVILLKHFGQTNAAGQTSLAVRVPDHAHTLIVKALSLLGKQSVQATVLVRGPQLKIVLRQKHLLTWHTRPLLEQLRAAASVIITADGNQAINHGLENLLRHAGIHFVLEPSARLEAQRPTPARQVVIITGGALLRPYQVGGLGLLPVTISGNLPGPTNAILAGTNWPFYQPRDVGIAYFGRPYGPARHAPKVIVAVAGNTVGDAVLLQGFADLLESKPLPAATMLPPAQAAAPSPAKVPQTYNPIRQFRRDISHDPGDRRGHLRTTLASYIRPATARIGSLAVGAGGATVYAGALNWDTNVYAINARTGQIRWCSHAGQGYVPHVWRGPAGGVLARISTTNNASAQLELFSAGGVAKERFAAPGVQCFPNGDYMAYWVQRQDWSFTVSPRGRVLVGGGNIGVAAWDASTGKMLWHKNTSRRLSTLDRMPAQRVAIAPDGRKVAIFYSREMGSALRYTPLLQVCALRTGKLLWQHQFAPFDHQESRTPIWSPDSRRLLVGNRNEGFVFDGSRQVGHLHGWPGRFRPGSPELFNGVALVSPKGSVLWSIHLAGHVVSWSWTSDGRDVAVTTDLGELAVYSAAGILLWHANIHGAGALVFHGKSSLYVGDWAGQLSKFVAATGQRLWTVNLGSARLAAPALKPSAYSRPPTVPLRRYWPNLPQTPRPAGTNIALARLGAHIKLCGQRGWGFNGRVLINPQLLIDGKTHNLKTAWQAPDEAWTALSFAVAPRAEILFPQPHWITGVIVHESTSHPGAFPLMVRITAHIRGHWLRVWEGLVNPALLHWHRFAKPVLADGVRYTILGSALNNVYTGTIEVMAVKTPH